MTLDVKICHNLNHVNSWSLNPFSIWICQDSCLIVDITFYMFYIYISITLIESAVLLSFYSALQEYWLRPFYYTMSYHYKEEPSPQINCLGTIQVCCHTHMPLLPYIPYNLPMLSRWKYGGWAYSNHPHMFFSMHMLHRHDCTHPSLFTSWNHSSKLLWGGAHMEFISCPRMLHSQLTDSTEILNHDLHIKSPMCYPVGHHHISTCMIFSCCVPF